MAKELPYFKFDRSEWYTDNGFCPNFKRIPESSGVYMISLPEIDREAKVINYGILYIGSSSNLRQRYLTHNVKPLLTDIYGYVQFHFKETDNYSELEIALIKSVRPKFNKHHNG